MKAAPGGAVLSVKAAEHQAACSVVNVGDDSECFMCVEIVLVCLQCVCVQMLVLVSLHVQGEVVGSGKGT